jgi:DNA-binding CsgD family transcriptional regulator
VHPLVRRAVERDIPASELAGRHLDAARLLHGEGAESGRVAAHLLAGRPEGDAWAVEQLRLAAREALANSAPGSAVSYLRRAMAEPPDARRRGSVLAELGGAEALAGVPTAAEHLARAAEATQDPRLRAELALQRGHALRQQGHQGQAARAYREGLRELQGVGRGEQEQELHDELQSGFLGAGSMVTELQAEALAQAPLAVARVEGVPQTHGQRLLLAHAALGASFAGRPAAEVVELGERAWSEGRLLEHETAEGMGWSQVSQALTLSGELERAVAVVDAARADAQRRSSPLAFATTSYIRATPQLWQGNVNEAIADLEQARGTRRFGWRQFVRGAAAQYALCLIERGELDRAEQVLEEEEPVVRPEDLEDAARVCALAELRLAQGRAEEALTLALDAGRQIERHVVILGYCPWRITAAQAAVQLGRMEQALELADKSLEMARRTGVRHAEIRALRVKAVASGGRATLELLRAAVKLGASLPPRLETLRAQVELGAALRRANRRAEAREVLSPAADLTQQRGLISLFDRARTEMAASGARPRREMILTGPRALTASERRIAQLAVQGESNREIAQALFVTPKTVEYHLRNAYRKLDISGRRELAEALSD